MNTKTKAKATSNIKWREGLGYLSKSNVEGKRWKMEFTDVNGKVIKTVNFASSEHENYTMHKDEQRQASYLKRHSKDPSDWDTAGELARIILWSAPTMSQGISNYEKKHRIKVVLKA